MSSVIVIQQTDAIHLITDGAQYDQTGLVVSLNSKAAHLRRSNCAFAIRGASWPKTPLTILLNVLESLDEIVENLPPMLRVMLSEYDKLQAFADGKNDPVKRNFEVTIAGWSDRMQRMVALVASTWAVADPDDQTGVSCQPGYVPCTPWIPAQGYSQPPLDWAGVLGRPFNDQSDVDAIDPIEDGFALHEAQRNEGGTYCGHAVYLIGGFAELTTVRRDRVEQQIIHEWPDAVGEYISPAGAPPLELLRSLIATDKAKNEALQAFLDARAELQERPREQRQV